MNRKECPNCYHTRKSKGHLKMSVCWVRCTIPGKEYQGWLQVGWYCRKCGHMEKL